MPTRRRVREVVLQILYEEDINPARKLSVAVEFLETRLNKNKPLVAFGEELLSGVRKNRQALDQMIGKHAANWSVKRMATIDRNVLRMATFEMIWGGVPGRVAINEAIELARRYSHHNSGQFVNGILDRILKETTPPACELDPPPSEASNTSDEVVLTKTETCSPEAVTTTNDASI